MYYSKIHKFDTVNANGFHVTLWVSGCRNYCEGCFSRETWNFNFGTEYTKETEDNIIRYLGEEYISGLSLLGGEIMEYENIDVVTSLAKRVKETYPDKAIWAWTGYLYEDILKDKSKANILKYVDLLIDGRYDYTKRDLNLYLRGSSNQRLINVKESLKSGTVVLVNK